MSVPKHVERVPLVGHESLLVGREVPEAVNIHFRNNWQWNHGSVGFDVNMSNN
jgi:hypothetical protein